VILERFAITNKRITKQHVVAVLGVDGSRDEDRIVEEKSKLEQLKHRAYNFFGIRIKKKMRDEAIRMEMINPDTGSVINRFTDIGKEFATIVSDRTARALFAVCFAVFDLSPNWDMELEMEFLSQENITYPPIEETLQNRFRIGRPAGTGLLSIIHDKKSEIVKLIMKKARRGHGYYISIRMLSDGTGPNRIRRRGGVYYEKFIVRDKIIESNIVNEGNCSWKKDLPSSLTNVSTEESTDSTESVHSTDGALSVSTKEHELLISDDCFSPSSNELQWSDTISLCSVESDLPIPVLVKKRISQEELSQCKREERSEKLVARKQQKEERIQKEIQLQELKKARSELDKLRKVRFVRLETYFLSIHF